MYSTIATRRTLHDNLVTVSVHGIGVYGHGFVSFGSFFLLSSHKVDKGSAFKVPTDMYMYDPCTSSILPCLLHTDAVESVTITFSQSGLMQL
jgi:hypothetical protein